MGRKEGMRGKEKGNKELITEGWEIGRVKMLTILMMGRKGN